MAWAVEAESSPYRETALCFFQFTFATSQNVEIGPHRNRSGALFVSTAAQPVS
jgi:hypothetical protein